MLPPSCRCAALLLWEPAVANRTWIPSACCLFQAGRANHLCIEDTSTFKSWVESLFHKGTSQHQNFRKASIQTGVPVEQPELPLVTPLSPQAAGDSLAIGFHQVPKTQEDTEMDRSCLNHDDIPPLRLQVRDFRSTNEMMWDLNRLYKYIYVARDMQDWIQPLKARPVSRTLSPPHLGEE